ncbi:hypothetical protein CRUP_037775 [Coryphaenoides rupestris]|nr:hypothetical protein CRUP_037775 [Coryphaenoides rupestris]
MVNRSWSDLHNTCVCVPAVSVSHCVRAKDSMTNARQMGQCWKRETHASHTHACRHGNSTRLMAPFWHTTQSLPVPSRRHSSSSSSSFVSSTSWSFVSSGVGAASPSTGTAGLCACGLGSGAPGVEDPAPRQDRHQRVAFPRQQAEVSDTQLGRHLGAAWLAVAVIDAKGFRILEGLAVVVLEVEGLLEEPGAAESGPMLVGLQCPLQGVHPAAPEAAQHTGLQAARLHGDPFWKAECVCVPAVSVSHCVRAKDSMTNARQMGQCWKRETHASHTHACRHGNSTRLMAPFWHTTQSLPVPSRRHSSSSSSFVSSTSWSFVSSGVGAASPSTGTAGLCACGLGSGAPGVEAPAPRQDRHQRVAFPRQTGRSLGTPSSAGIWLRRGSLSLSSMLKASGLAVVVLEVEGLLEEPGAAESGPMLVGLQCPLQGVHPAAPEAAQHTGLQAARLHGDPFWKAEGPDPSSRAKGLVTWIIVFSGVGRVDSVSSLLRRMTGTSNPNLEDEEDTA